MSKSNFHPQKEVVIRNIKIGNGNPLVLIAGPCVIEDEKTVLSAAERILTISQTHRIPFIFKSSFEKDNRSHVSLYRGPGLKKGLEILQKVKDEFNIPVISDVHRETDIAAAAEILDIIQIPAYLCQQTSLLVKAGKTNKPVNIKKGQFLAPENMRSPVGKIESTGNTKILLTERGSCFGYNRLVSDICSIPIMQTIGYPVVYDSTHIIRIYGIPSSDTRGGLPGYISHLTRAGVAAGCDAIFIETHPNPEKALCDAASMLCLDLLPRLLEEVLPIGKHVRAMKGNE
ncbi:MAG: 3-deoxy-8-phosphooctulonate synthase [Spirochaetales bacterium]|nr:3-deoxy-8-phosphooctulonate synthase [Spirochaetales bacterium]